MKPKIYVSSKIIFGPMWIEYREKGYNIISTWIDDWNKTIEDLKTLSINCVEEPKQADYLILYCNPGEHLKFCLIELGAALAANRKVIIVGDSESMSPAIYSHPNITRINNLDEAFKLTENK